VLIKQKKSNIEEMTSKTIVSNNISVQPHCIFIRELGLNDVLLGRGTGPNEHIGNVRFRSLVRASIQTPVFFSPTPDGKLELAKKIVNTVKARNGRFVKRVNTRNTCGDIFVEVPERVSLDKTKQSFRHQLRSSSRGDKEIKYRAMLPRSLIESKSTAWAILSPVADVGKSCAPNTNSAAIKQHRHQSAVFNKKLNGPTLSGIMDPLGPLFVDELIRLGEVGATRTASIVASPQLVDSIVFKNASQMLSSAIRRDLFVSNRILLSELMWGQHHQSGLLAPPPATAVQIPQRPAMPILTSVPRPDTALLNCILQGRLH
jgi:hypothetical protein